MEGLARTHRIWGETCDIERSSPTGAQTPGTMIRKRFSLAEAQNMPDDSSVEMTRVYADRDREQAVEIARQVG